MIDSGTTVRRKEDLLAYDMDGETVMMSVEQGDYFALDQIGGRIWELIEKPIRVADLLQTLGKEFEVEEEVCQKDTLTFLNKLDGFAILEVVDDASA